MKIDAHQHFWRYDSADYPWIQLDWPLRRDFYPQELESLLKQNGFGACVAVQARQSLEETRWLLQLAGDHSVIAGVVGWVDLRSDRVEEELNRFLPNPKFVGVRHVVQDEPDDQFMLQPDFVRGLGQLQTYGLTYDILIFPKQLPAAIEIARQFPAQPFVLDHMAKPLIKDRVFEPWSQQIRELGKSPNVLCKISGLVTEARWHHWHPEDFRPYLDLVWEVFGEDRLMAGSDWPVCLLSADYENVMNLIEDFLSQFPPATREKVLGQNAKKFYGLKF